MGRGATGRPGFHARVVPERDRTPAAARTQELLDVHGTVLAWKRGDAITVAANLSPTPAVMPRPVGELVLESEGVRFVREDAALELPPWGCAVVRG